MRADQIIRVGGTLNGKRVVSEPLPANEAIYRFNSYELANIVVPRRFRRPSS
jgi:hypothetical protein